MTPANPDSPSTETFTGMNLHISFAPADWAKFEENAVACGFENPQQAIQFALNRFNSDIEALRIGMFPAHIDPLTEKILFISCPEYATAANITSFDALLKLGTIKQDPPAQSKPQASHLRLVASTE